IYDSKMEGSKALESSRDMCLSDLENNHPKVDKREKNQKSLVKDPKFEAMLIQQNRADKSSCDICKEKKLQINSAFGEKNLITLSSVFTKDLMEKQKPWSLGGKIQTEPENKVTFCKIHGKSLKGNGIEVQNEEKQLSEVSALSDEKQWHDVNVFLGLANCPGSKQPERLEVECQNHMERSETSCSQKNVACLGEGDMCESKCCHPSNFIIEAPGHMSDVEWMSIFKPSKMQRIVRHKSVCTCSESISGTKYNSSMRLVTVTTAHLAYSAMSAFEKLLEMKSKSYKHSPPSTLPPIKHCPKVNEECLNVLSSQDDFSPTSKLQRLLAESRQMVTDLELSTLLPISCENLNSSAQNNSEVSEEPAQKNLCQLLKKMQVNFSIHCDHGNRFLIYVEGRKQTAIPN
uniref:Uncharacterized protein n=1 Tax=Otolemur garnettii TaxID=30611 RepID=H0XKK5_OTOGA